MFVDDDPANRQEVAANAPGVTVVPLPADPAEYCQALTQLWVFDSATRLTAEDRERASMMQQEQERHEMRQAHAQLGDYLRDLKLRVEMREATPFDLPRVSQLEQKTNQFNLSLGRRTLDELKALGRNHPIFVVQAADRFGDYGLIGTCVLAADTADSTHYRLDTLILSCRALGRGIEEAVLDGLLREVKSRGGTRLVAKYVPGPRNEPVREFLRRCRVLAGNRKPVRDRRTRREPIAGPHRMGAETLAACRLKTFAGKSQGNLKCSNQEPGRGAALRSLCLRR